MNKIAGIVNSPTFKRMLVGSFWSVFGIASEKAITLASIIFVVRILGKDNYGLFAILQSTLAMAGAFAALGLGTTATKHIAELRFSDPVRLGRILAMTQRLSYSAGIALFLILSIGSPFICGTILHQPELIHLLPFGAIAVVLNTIDGYQSGALLGFEAVRKSAVGYFIAALIAAPISVVLAMWKGIDGAVAGLILTASIRYFVSSSILRACISSAEIVLDRENWRQEFTVFIHFALPSFLSGLALAPAHWICHTMLISSAGGKSEMAVLGVANQWYYSILFIPLAANRVLLPIITDLVSRRGANTSNKAAVLTVLANITVMLPTVAVVWLASPWIMGMYGADYVAHSTVLSVAVAAAAASAILMPIGHILTSRSKMWVGFSLNMAWAFFYVSITYIYLDRGAMGVMMGLLGAYMLHGLASAGAAWFYVLRKDFRALPL